jgi:hypothetical protein
MLVVTGCGGGGGGGATEGGKSVANAPSESGPAPQPDTGGGVADNTPPTIAGSPAASIVVGAAYDLVPRAQDADGDTLAFSVENRPEWATFDTTSGRLSGTPAAGHVGTSSEIIISVSDGRTSVALPAFSITVALAGIADIEPVTVDGNAVALSWDVPTRTMMGQTLADLSGYRIHYGKHPDVLSESVEIKSAGANTFVVQDLAPGTYYFAVRAVTENGSQSSLSNVISRVIG